MPFLNGSQMLPHSPTTQEHPPQNLLSRDFLLIFCIAMCSNCFIAVFYCFEQWLDAITVPPAWRGLLISSLFGMVLLFRPIASIFFLRRSKLAAMAVSMLIFSATMLGYPLVESSGDPWIILALRMIQGAALAVTSSCTVAVLVSCIPAGQSARGFALFSLTLLLPYSIIPAVAEKVLPLLGGEANLFALTALLGLPALVMLLPLAPRLRQPDLPLTDANDPQQEDSSLWQAVRHSGLALVYLACLTFGTMTMTTIFFMKGLCSLTGAEPAIFFSTYTITIMLVRLIGSHQMDRLPRYRVTVLCCVLLVCCMLGLAWGPRWLFFPLTALYGLCLGLLYPLMAGAIYDRSTPATRSLNSNIMMAAFDASGVFGPLLGGLVVQAGLGYRGVFTALAVNISLCGLCLILDRQRLLRQEELSQKSRSDAN